MEILSYLAELVKTRKEVGIPGIGTFYKKKSPGRYDAETHAFIPPTYALDFSTEVREHDALAAFISDKKNISADSANYYIDQFSKTLQSELSANGSAALAELGLLKQNQGELTFHPDEHAALGFDFYGLPKLQEETSVVVAQPDIETPEKLSEETEQPISEPIEELEEPGEAQMLLEEQNADLSDGMTEFEVIKADEEEEIDEEPEEEDEPVYEEISEIDHHIYQQVTEAPVIIETAENLEEEEEEKVEEEIQETSPVAAPEEEPLPVIVEETAPVHVEEPVPVQETVAQETPAEQDAVPMGQAEAVPVAQIDEPEPVKAPEIEEESIPVEEKPTLVRRAHEPTYVSAEAGENGSVWNFYTSNTPDSAALATNAEEKKPISFLIKVLIAIVVLAAIVAVAYFLKPELFRQLVSDKNPKRAITVSSRPDTSRLKSNATALADSLTKVTAKPVAPEASTLKDTVQIKPATLPAATAMEKETTLRYEIIAASLANKTEANNFLAQMRNRGIKAKIANLPGKRIKITLGTFTDEATAKKELELLKTSTKIPDIYIFKVTHTNTNHK